MKRILLLLCIAASALHFSAQRSPYTLIPEPRSIAVASGEFTWSRDTRILFNGPCEQEATWFAEWLSAATGNVLRAEPYSGNITQDFILFNASGQAALRPEDVAHLPGNLGKLIDQQPEGAYDLSMDARAIIVKASSPTGVFHAMQTLRQMLPAKAEVGKLELPVILPCVRIEDAPAFAHRGLLLDCCRHFMDVDYVKRTIDLLALHKMNVLHWHLTEDQAWRIQILAYPELTTTGAWRMENGLRYGGFYTQEDIRSIVQYAEDRHVLVIPEIEMPGHSVAAIAAYPELSCTGEKIPVETEWGVFKDIYCAGNENTFAFLEKVLDEVCALFPSPYIHIGGDEVPKYRWEHCEKCQRRMQEEKLASEAELQTWFIERIAAYLETKGKQIIGWDEILDGGIPANAIVQSWRGFDGGIAAVKQGHGVIMSPTSHCYLDYPIESIDLQKAYSFDPIPPGLSDDEARLVRGAQGNMWTERVTQETIDSRIYPRLLALSEVLWTYPEERNYADFRTRVFLHGERLALLGVKSGFAEVPVHFSAKPGWYNQTEVTVTSTLPGIELKYLVMPLLDAGVEDQFRPLPDEPLLIGGASSLEIEARDVQSGFTTRVVSNYANHMAKDKPLTLGYTPSPWYTGGGTQALADGLCGTNAFRDGKWQAVQGQDMTATVDLGNEQSPSFFASRWFHYANAWIFRPDWVIYETSLDGKTWTEAGRVAAPVEQNTSGEFPVLYALETDFTKCRYVRMTATNIGPCPAWHDAVGEPSWLFVDELIVR